MSEQEQVLISIYPEFADAILRGDKTVELRRRVHGLKSGTKMWIYATKPVGAIVGYALIGGISKGPPETMWRIFGESAAVEKEHYNAYFADASMATCITLTGATRGEPLLAEHFRKARPKFHPPQVYTRISSFEAKFLSNYLFPSCSVV